MSILWLKDSRLGQKVIVTLTVYLMLSAAVYVFAYPDFVPGKSIFWPTLIISVGVSLAIVVFVIRDLKNKTWEVSKRFSNYGRVRKVVACMTLPIFIFLMIWLNFYYIVPRAVTSFSGEESYRLDTAVVQKNYGRYRGCGYSIKLHATRSFIFKFCTNAIFYKRSPKEAFQVKIHTKESPLGLIVTKVDRIQ